MKYDKFVQIDDTNYWLKSEFKRQYKCSFEN